MALYSPNSNLPGAKKQFSSEAVPPQGSSAKLYLLQVVLDPLYVQNTLDGYVTCETNTDTSKVIFKHDTDLKANELRGQWCMVNFATPQVKQIVSHAAATAGSNVTLTVLTPFSAAPTAGQSATVRRWEDWYLPSFHTSVNEFAEKFIDKNTSGNYVWTGMHSAYQSLKALFDNGAAGVWVVPVERHGSAPDLVAALAPGFSTALTTRLLSISPLPDVVVCPDNTELLTSADGSSLSSSQWATVDNAWITYITNRATSESSDEALRELVYVTSTKTSSSSSATTYVATTVNTTSERVFWVHGQYLSPSLTAGEVDILSPSAAAAAMINRVSTTASESFGHAIFGEQFTQLQNSQGLVEEITQANRQSLITYGINCFITKQGKGTFLESQYTASKSTSDSGLDPLEHLHIVVGRASIWNTLQPILSGMVSQQNTAINRAVIESQVRGYMDGLKNNKIISDYSLKDTTTSSDITTSTVRFELKPLFVGAVNFIELKLVAAFAS